MRVDGSISYPKGIFELAYYGFDDGVTRSLGGFGVDVSAFTEIGLGWSRSDFIIPNLDVGVRGKALFGLANISTRSSVFDVYTSTDEWTLHTDMEFAISTTSLLIDFESYDPGVDDFPIPDFTALSQDFLSDPITVARDVFSEQFGVSADIGINYRPIPQLLISASMIDIGYINWKNTMLAGLDFDYGFEGIELNPFAERDTTILSALLDSVSNSFMLTQGDAYMARLNSKLFIGASFYPLKKLGFGILSRTDFLSQQKSQQFTGTVNMTTGKFLNLSLSYSYRQSRLNNMGAGFSINLGPTNMYIISDNIISAGLRPLDARSVNLWFGMNTTFGWKRVARAKNKKTKKSIGVPAVGKPVDDKVDKPLI